ncbi:uncharacterized protein LACBIDRAFT_310521 [Laccaria bicolor S238N-H82]|uniref:Predicted protein n=1 Tax=Laccaria bicolor (strain S238N-H82 / ATCC MYA-4686) TaxID=486041 RepID=B0DUI7_LACBS|nr:uncharacterized protein LACBIDRAFT_310521 [Laccaria bicolor S238N-H82]EDR01746.1 predicted protein [Laccaria bicolor S238N-H82]|eukprot:XP_001887559.1 predicted protein [Laccaria bicolor S238N-H82]
MWSPRPWSSETQWWLCRRGRWRFRRHSGLVSGEATWLQGGCCIPCWFAKRHWVFLDGAQRWIPSVGACSWPDSVSVGGLSWALGCCRG